jgi:hypothetical protein
MNNDHIFLYWDTYETPQSGSIENDVENNNQNDKTKSNNTRRDNTRVHR